MREWSHFGHVPQYIIVMISNIIMPPGLLLCLMHCIIAALAEFDQLKTRYAEECENVSTNPTSLYLCTIGVQQCSRL